MSPAPISKGLWFPPAEFYTAELCSRCGVCCGSTDGNPCVHLRCDEEGAHFCEIYEKRLGVRRAKNDARFLCVQIQTVIENYGGYAGCAYVKEIIRIRESMGQDTSDLGRMKQPSA